MNRERALAGVKVLLAEDVAANRFIAGQIVAHNGGAFVAVNNGKEAVRRFLESAAGEYSIILMDIQMPGMNGWEAAASIRASAHPDAKTIPIVAVTSENSGADIKRCLACGMDHCLEKPYFPQELVETIRRFSR